MRPQIITPEYSALTCLLAFVYALPNEKLLLCCCTPDWRVALLSLLPKYIRSLRELGYTIASFQETR